MGTLSLSLSPCACPTPASEQRDTGCGSRRPMAGDTRARLSRCLRLRHYSTSSPLLEGSSVKRSPETGRPAQGRSASQWQGQGQS